MIPARNFVTFEVDDKSCFEVPASSIQNVQLDRMKKQELVIEFKGADAKQFYKALSKITNQGAKKSKAIASFPDMTCKTPRGRYEMELYTDHVHLHGAKYSYKLHHKAIQRIFLLPKPDLFSVYLAIYVSPAIRQGQTSYPFFIMELPRPRDGLEDDDKIDVEMNMDETELAKYDGLNKIMSGPLFEVLSRVLKILSGKKITVPSTNFQSKINLGSPCMSCSLKNETGLLYILESALMFVLKPPTYVHFKEILMAEFDRQGGTTSRTFRLNIETKTMGTHTFSNITAEEYNNLKTFLVEKKVNVDELAQADYNYAALGNQQVGTDHYAERMKQDGDEGSSGSSEDEDFAPGQESDVEEEYDSEAGQGSSGGDSDASSDGGESDDSTNKKPKKSKATAKKEKSPSAAKKRKSKGKVDPNKPKRPATAYIIFSADKRPEMLKEYPGLSLGDFSKKLGDLWKETSEEDRKPYVKQAAEKKKEYEIAMAKYKIDHPESDNESGPKAKKSKASSTPSKLKQTKLTSSKPARNSSTPNDKKVYSAEFIEDSDDMLSN
ncbi:hypothetical protein SARC_00230 [Sphaeroforma arctica JP610]|uniref:FACT complex subunit SSRP1 n=1 Tax=Sphaeroforma arctica JP610 TaxID=667725 RepID=A0A0L0GFP0_9EUKA|nr:hypothetical protein SARC_00230 [Sphaeroforma arctica JP610]KNC87659.1 hypothetical protein SARC_00230 [Sphaeroforma arctica JP610]|eukprot:XP_014161561.1 hypothetical protein SARC_00230 [Sphaeroforma arctica JP610]